MAKQIGFRREEEENLPEKDSSTEDHLKAMDVIHSVFIPVADVFNATAFLTTDDLIKQVHAILPELKITSHDLHDLLLRSGFRYQAVHTSSIRWILQAK